MASKNQVKWPWNNRPSSRHIWYCVNQQTDGCRRCGTMFYRPAGGTGAVYCYPKPEWLKDHPEDDGKLGECETPFG